MLTYDHVSPVFYYEISGRGQNLELFTLQFQTIFLSNTAVRELQYTHCSDLLTHVAQQNTQEMVGAGRKMPT